MQQYFLTGTHCHGSAPRGPLLCDRDIVGTPLSKLFYCVECGTVYGTAPVVLQDLGGPTASWRAIPGCCTQCTPRSGLHVPGSIWDYESAYTDAFPSELLLQELTLHLNYYERYLQP
jgi:hypothetical protein